MEPTIVINGKQLTEAQAMAVRVAVSDFLAQLTDKDFMKSLGAAGPMYQARLAEVQRLMLLG